jgi:hypothetical protein
VASAVYKSRATLRPTTLLLIAVTPPLPARARIPATLQPASPFQRLLPYLVWQRRAHGTPTILPVGRLVSVSIFYSYHQWQSASDATQLQCCMVAFAGQTNNLCISNMDGSPTSLYGTQWYLSTKQLGPAQKCCLFLLDMLPTLPVRRNVARVHMPIGPHPRLKTASVHQLSLQHLSLQHPSLLRHQCLSLRRTNQPVSQQLSQHHPSLLRYQRLSLRQIDLSRKLHLERRVDSVE